MLFFNGRLWYNVHMESVCNYFEFLTEYELQCRNQVLGIEKDFYDMIEHFKKKALSRHIFFAYSYKFFHDASE